MSLKNPNRTRALKVTAASTAVVVGVTYLVLKSFPHIKTSLYNYVTGTKDDADDEAEDEEDHKPIELKQSKLEESDYLNGSSLVDVQEWTEENLRSFLISVSIK